MVACVGNGNGLPLTSNKLLWEARSSDEWKAEKAIYDMDQPMMKFSELIKARGNPRDPVNVRILESWGAGADTMAVMLNIATTCV